MNLSSWFKQQNKRLTRLVTLEQSILSGNFKSYGFYRLKFFNLQLFVHYLFHLVFVCILLRHFNHLHASHLILILAGAVTITNAWWGGLEVMRTRIRSCYKRGEVKNTGRMIGLWLAFSLMLSILLLGLSLGLIGTQIRSIISLESYYYLALISILLSLAIQLPVRTYHSGIYALSRVARGTLSIFISDIVFILTLSFSYPWLKLYSIPFCILLRNIIGQIITVYYVRQVYRFRDIQIRKPSLHQMKQFFSSFPLKEFLLASSSMAVMAMEHILIAAWFIYEQYNIHQQNNVTLLVIILPLMYAAVDWAKLFYYDYKKEMSHDFDLFHRKFEDKVIYIALFSGLLYWFFSCLTAYFLMPGSILLCLGLLPIFVLRSKIAILQIKQFALENYKTVIVSQLTFMSLVGALYIAPIVGIIKISLLTMICLFLIFHLKHCKTPKRKGGTEKTSLHIYAWLESLCHSAETKAVEVHVFKLPDYLKTKSIKILVKQLCLHLGKIEHETCIYNQQILLYTNSINAINLDQLILLSGGWIYFHQSFLVDSIKVIQKKLLLILDPPLQKKFTYSSIDAIKTTFFNYFPRGICFAPDYQLGPNAIPLSSGVMKQVVHTVKRYLKDPRDNYLDGYFLSIFYCSRNIKIIFLIPKHNNRREIKPSCSSIAWQKNIDFISKMAILNENY